MRVRHSESKAIWEEVIVRSGDLGSLQEGRRVEESRLRRKRSELVRDSAMRVPLDPTSVHVVLQYQAGLWALKSHMMMLL